MKESYPFDGDFWFTERHSPNVGFTVRIKEHLLTRQSPFQLIEIFDTYDLGRMLVLDRMVMLSERDECAYHEMMVHVPMLCHPNPRRVLVIGGGDGGCLRELVKHSTLEQAIQVEIDRDVVDLCRAYFPGLASAYDHPKVELVVADAIEFVSTTRIKFDVIIIDSTEPIGPAIGLFQAPFYENLRHCLTDDGIMVNQIGSTFFDLEHVAATIQKLKSVFSEVKSYATQVVVYPSGVWRIGFSTKGQSFWNIPDDVRYNTLKDELNYYNLETHNSSFALPQYAQRVIKD